LRDRYVPRVISFIVLLAITLLVGAVFFQVMAQFLVPLFLACVLLVVFQPLHRWLLRRLPTSPRVAAAITTVLIVLVVLLPTSWLGWKAFTECQRVYHMLQQGEETASADANATADADQPDHAAPPSNPLTALTKRLSQLSKEYIGQEINTSDLVGNTTSVIGWVLGGVKLGTGVLLGLFILVVSLYYFLVDGPGMIQTLMQLSPLDPAYEQELLKRFSEISRAVVVATLSGAVVQGIAAGIGFYFALPKSAPIFLLTAATMVLAMVPFIGAIGVWVPTCVYVLLYGERIVDGQITYHGNWHVALALFIYCGLVVSTVDNILKPYILHGQSNLHPLLALLSIVGGLTALGPVGILIGPMLVSFLQALLQMFHRELAQFGDPADQIPGTLAHSVATASSANGGTPRPLPAEAPATPSPTNRPKKKRH
jgi:predicted PurR-regulated permease PerM